MAEPNFLQTMSPLLISLRYLGLCPLMPVFSNGRVGFGFRWLTCKMVHLYFNLVIMSMYVLYMSTHTFQWKAPETKKSALSLIEKESALYGTLFPIGMLCLIVVKRKQLIQFYARMFNLQNHLGNALDLQYVKKVSKILFVTYFTMGFIMAVFEGIHIWSVPNEEYSISHLFPESGLAWKIFTVGFHFYLFLLKAYCCAFTEIVCSALALMFKKTIKHLQVEFLDPYKFEMSYGRLEDKESAKMNNVSILGFIITNELKPDTLDDKEISHIQNNEVSDLRHPKDENISNITSSANVVLDGLKKFQIVAAMQMHVNNLFGPILTLNVTLMVFLTCVNVYTQIRHLELVEQAATFNELIDIYKIMFHSGFVIVRLIIIFSLLGNVHNAAMNFNFTLSSALVNLKDMKTVEMNTILAYLTTNAINPVSFSAGGYFIFSRSCLLTVASIIVTYVVLLLQF